MITTLMPLIVLYSPNIQGNSGYPTTCQLAPRIGPVALLNDGGQPWGAESNNIYFVAYKSDPENTDIIGNYSVDAVTWTPALSGTDPPTHYLFVQKDFPTDCAFYPAVDQFGNIYAMAWLETQPTGRLDLKYIEASQAIFGTPNGVPNTPFGGTTVPARQQSTFYLYPRISLVESIERTESIPLGDITVTDIAGNTFTFDPNETFHRGAELTLDYPIKSFKWTQRFRMTDNHVVGVLTTIPTQENGFTTNPLPAVAVNVYRNHGTYLERRVTTDAKGFFEFDLVGREYTFEVESQNISINVSQRVL